MPLSPDLRRRNARLGWILFSVAMAFGLGFVAKAILFGI